MTTQQSGVQQSGVQQIIQDVKDTPLQKIAQTAAQIGVNSLPVSKENKDALTGISQKITDKISPDRTVGNIFTKPTNNSIEKTEVASNIPKFKGISGWDKFKNFMGRIGGKPLGLTTHEITDADYVWNPKKDKEGNVLIDKKTGKEQGDWKFNWDKAREVDKARGKSIRTEFDPTKIIGIASKIASKGAM